MGYVLVSADFPGITSDQRDKIYKCLENKNWIKVKEVGRDISTTWWALFESSVAEQVAIRISKENFESCSSPYTKPKLVIHFGPNKPTFVL